MLSSHTSKWGRVHRSYVKLSVIVLVLVLMQNSDLARRFITLVDELYNRGGRLYCSAAVPIEELFSPEGSAYTPEQYLEMAEQFQFEAEACVDAWLACLLAPSFFVVYAAK